MALNISRKQACNDSCMYARAALCPRCRYRIVSSTPASIAAEMSLPLCKPRSLKSKKSRSPPALPESRPSCSPGCTAMRYHCGSALSATREQKQRRAYFADRRRLSPGRLRAAQMIHFFRQQICTFRHCFPLFLHTPHFVATPPSFFAIK
jgi:hypothetical protein